MTRKLLRNTEFNHLLAGDSDALAEMVIRILEAPPLTPEGRPTAVDDSKAPACPDGTF